MKAKLNYHLYLVTDRSLMSTNALLEAVKEALKGGITLLQLREKDLDSKGFYQEACQIKQITKQFNVPLIINDRVDIALACDADGVHVGQKDLPVAKVRQMMGPDKVIGASVQTVAEAIEAERAGADYLGVGAMFPTDTKTDAISVSREVLENICQQVTLPIVLIGGINKKTIPTFGEFPVQGFAVVSAIIAQQDIQKSSEELLSLVVETLQK